MAVKERHFQRPLVTLKVICLLQAFTNMISYVVVQQSTRFQLTQSIAQSLCDSYLFLHEVCVL